MRYTISVQHSSDFELDGKWYPLSRTDSAEAAIIDYIRFSNEYGRPTRIEDAKFNQRPWKDTNHDQIPSNSH